MLGLLAAFFGIWWGGSAVVRDFEGAAAREIAAKLGEGAKVSVNARVGLEAVDAHIGTVTIRASGFRVDGLPLYTEPDRSQYGRVDRLRLELRDFTLCDLPVERMEMRMQNARYDHGLAVSQRRFRLSRSGTGVAEVSVTQAALAQFVRAKFREIKEVDIRLADGRAVIEGFGEFIVVQTRFRVDGKLACRDGMHLTLEDAHIEFDGKAAGPELAEALLNTLNPIIDLDRDLRLAGAIYVQELKVERGRLNARGTCIIPNSLTGTIKPQ